MSETCEQFDLCGCSNARDGHCMYCCKQHSVEEMAAFTLNERSHYLGEIAALEATNARLNRRCQEAEAALAEKLEASPSGSLGRALANAAASMYKRELEDERRRNIAAVEATHDLIDDDDYGIFGFIREAKGWKAALQRIQGAAEQNRDPYSALATIESLATDALKREPNCPDPDCENCRFADALAAQPAQREGE